MLRGQTMVQTSQICSKWLVWMAALLSPIQALQGTPVLCHFICGCSGADGVYSDQPTCCHHGSSKLTATRAACGKSIHCGLTVTRDNPLSPCRCPLTCLCRRPALPQSQTLHTLSVEPSAHLDCLSVGDTDANADMRVALGVAQNHYLPAFSAPQVCASLCRFLI